MFFIILVSFLAKHNSYEGIYERVSRNFSTSLETPLHVAHTHFDARFQVNLDRFTTEHLKVQPDVSASTVFRRESAAGSEGKASKQAVQLLLSSSVHLLRPASSYCCC